MKRISLMFMFVNLLIFCNNKKSFGKNKNFTSFLSSKIYFSNKNIEKNSLTTKLFNNEKYFYDNEFYRREIIEESETLSDNTKNLLLDDKNTPKLSQGKFKIRIDEILNNRNNSSGTINNTRNELTKAIDKFEEIQKYIGVRLYDNEYISYIGEENLITMKISEDIYATLILDYPDMIKNIFPAQIKPWQKTIGQLFEIGIKNIKEKYAFRINNVKIDNHQLLFIEEEHFFVPNIIFELENRKDLVGNNGVLIGLPTRHCAIIYPLNDENIKTVTQKIIPTMNKINEKGHGSLSKNLYWYNNRKIINVSDIVDDRTMLG